MNLVPWYRNKLLWLQEYHTHQETEGGLEPDKCTSAITGVRGDQRDRIRLEPTLAQLSAFLAFRQCLVPVQTTRD